MCEASAVWADRGAEKAAGYMDESFMGYGATLVATGIEASKCWAYNQLENSIHLIIPEADVARMLGGGFKCFGGFMLAAGSSTLSWIGLGVLGMAAGGFVVGAGASDMNQGWEEFFLGLSGDSTTQTRNGMSDLFYDGNDTIYHLSTGVAAFAGSLLTPYVNAEYGKTGVMAAGSTAGNGKTAGTTVTQSGVRNAQTAGTTVTGSATQSARATGTTTAGKATGVKPTVTEAAGGTADDALEQFYDDIFESDYGEQFDPVREQAIAGAEETSGGGMATHIPSSNTQVIRHPEVKAPYQVKASDVANYWDDYLGSDQTNINPRTGQVDNDRIFSADGTRSVRFGDHEMNSMETTKFHFHQEEWIYDAVNDVMEYSNTLVRIRK